MFYICPVSARTRMLEYIPLLVMDEQRTVQKRKVIIRYERAKSPNWKQRRRRVFPPPPDPEPFLVDVHSFTEFVQNRTGREAPGQNAAEEQNSPAVEDLLEETSPHGHERQAGQNSNTNHPPEHSDIQFAPTPADFMSMIELISRMERDTSDDFREFVEGNGAAGSRVAQTDFLHDIPSPLMEPHFLLASDLPPLNSEDTPQPSAPEASELNFPVSIAGLFSGTAPLAYRTASDNLRGGGSGTGDGGGEGRGDRHNSSNSSSSSRSLTIWEHFKYVDEVSYGDSMFHGDLG